MFIFPGCIHFLSNTGEVIVVYDIFYVALFQDTLKKESSHVSAQ